MMAWGLFLGTALLAGCLAWMLVRTRERQRAGEEEGRLRRDALEAEVAARAEREAELQRATEAAKAANQAKTRYLVAASHEIRSPLNTIYGYAQLLERDDGISCGEAGASIRRSAEHLTNLVDGLLDISRIEGGVLKLRSEVVDVRDMLEHVADMFRVQAASKGLTLDLSISDRLPDRVKSDAKRLRQILINLVSNAVKYTASGRVAIEIAYRSQVAEVIVTDTGMGIAPEDLERIFEPFERGRSPLAQSQPGVGLGLAITRVLVRVLGGDIDVTSTPGEGSRFRLRLLLPPLWNWTESDPPGGRITGYAGARRGILLADDDPAQLGMLRSLLTKVGFDVRTAADGPDAVDLAEQDRPDLALLDIQMPSMSGWDVARRLRARHGDALRIVMVSANAHDFSAGGDDASDHDAFVVKPVDFDALLAVIGTQLGLDWTRAEVLTQPFATGRPNDDPVLPPAFLTRIRDHARIGHVDGIERVLVELEDEVPASLTLVSTLRRHVNNFDLGSLLNALDDAER